MHKDVGRDVVVVSRVAGISKPSKIPAHLRGHDVVVAERVRSLAIDSRLGPASRGLALARGTDKLGRDVGIVDLEEV